MNKKCHICGKESGLFNHLKECDICHNYVCKDCCKEKSLSKSTSDLIPLLGFDIDIHSGWWSTYLNVCKSCESTYHTFLRDVEGALNSNSPVRLVSKNYKGYLRYDSSNSNYVESYFHKDRNVCEEEIQSVARYFGHDMIINLEWNKDTREDDNYIYSVYQAVGLAVSSIKGEKKPTTKKTGQKSEKKAKTNGGKKIRLMDFVRKYGVGIDTIVDFLNSKGYNFPEDVNYIVEDLDCETLLDQQFAIDKEIQELSNRVNVKLSDIVNVIAKPTPCLPAPDVKAKKCFLIDTNVFINHPTVIQVLPKESIKLIPNLVLDELDRNKRKEDIRPKIAEALKLIKEFLVRGDVQVIPTKVEVLPEGYNANSPDNKILSAAIAYRTTNPEDELSIITDDVNLQTKFIAEGFAIAEKIIYGSEPEAVATPSKKQKEEKSQKPNAETIKSESPQKIRIRAEYIILENQQIGFNVFDLKPREQGYSTMDVIKIVGRCMSDQLGTRVEVRNFIVLNDSITDNNTI